MANDHDLDPSLELLVRPLNGVCNRYEICRCQRSAAVFYSVVYGTTIGSEAAGARIAGPAIQAMRREFELGAGHLCDSLRCSKSPNSHLSSRRSSDADETSDWTRHLAKLRRDVWGGEGSAGSTDMTRSAAKRWRDSAGQR